MDTVIIHQYHFMSQLYHSYITVISHLFVDQGYHDDAQEITLCFYTQQDKFNRFVLKVSIVFSNITKSDRYYFFSICVHFKFALLVNNYQTSTSFRFSMIDFQIYREILEKGNRGIAK